MTSSAQNSKQYLAQQGSAAVPAYSFLGDQDTGIYRSGANELSIATNGTQRAVVDSSGNVGIGTSSPSNTLDVAGSVAVGATLYTGTGVSTADAVIEVGGTRTGSGNSYVDFHSTTGTDYEARIIRDSGANGGFSIINRGTADFTLTQFDGAPILFKTSNNERMRIDSSGNVGIGTSSPSYKLDVYGNASFASTIFTGTGVSTGDAVIELGGNRTGNGNSFIDFHSKSGTDNEARIIRGPDTNGGFTVQNTGTGALALTQVGAGPILFSTSNTERARIDSSGNFIVGTTDPSAASGVGVKLLPSGATGCVLNDGAAALNTLHVYNENATNNGYRFYVNTNGGVSNYSANNVNLSDVRTKKDIENAGPYLAKICAIPVRTFRYKDQDGDWTNVGVIAQEVEAVAPELVDPDGWLGEVPEDGVPLKAVYQTDLTFALMKAIQELKTQLDDAKNRIAALEAA